MEELTTYTLEEISIGKGTYGIGAPAIPFDKNKRTYLRITDINEDGTLNKDGLMSVEEEKADEYLLAPNDIVFARTGNSTGRTYFYEESDGIFCYAGFLIKFTLNPNKVNPRMLKYYTHSKAYYDWVHSFETGGTRGNINAKTYGQMPVTLPSKERQDRIVEICKSLDDKIEVNKRINDNLEQQAQALFKSWFVDFEPFKKGKFIDSELGMIPEGWQVEELGNITNSITEKVGKRTDVKVLSPVNTGDLLLSEEYFTKQVYSKNLAKYIMVAPNDFSYNPARINIGSIGMNTFDFSGCVSPVYVVFRCEKGYHHFFNIFKTTKNFKEEVNTRAIGGVRQTLSYKDFSLIKIVYPPKEAVEQFNKIYSHIMTLIKKNVLENKRLHQTRDTLLPKLMSGELKINDINN